MRGAYLFIENASEPGKQTITPKVWHLLAHTLYPMHEWVNPLCLQQTCRYYQQCKAHFANG